MHVNMDMDKDVEMEHKQGYQDETAGGDYSGYNLKGCREKGDGGQNIT